MRECVSLILLIVFITVIMWQRGQIKALGAAIQLHRDNFDNQVLRKAEELLKKKEQALRNTKKGWEK